MVGIVILASAFPHLAAAQDCAACHPAQAAAHRATHHARSLRPVLETEFARELPQDRPIGEARNGFLLHYSPAKDGLEVTARRGTELSRARIEWAFGAGDQGVTPVAVAQGRWIEHRISYYPKAGRFDLTLGHRRGASATAPDAIGIVQPDQTIRACLTCHATLAATSEVAVAIPGVDCQRCHSGAEKHSRDNAQRAGKPDVETCAACHRLTPAGRADDPLNIRFQPLRLVQSKCYRVGRIGCQNCHPPHQNARRDDPGFYEQQCAACHAKPHRAGGCLECHMPKSSPAPYLTFTDHYIRVAKK